MEQTPRYPTPLSWAERFGIAVVPLFAALGLLLGIAARGWMRLIAVTPEFTISGTLGIVLGFAFFGLMQSIAALASARRWRTWPRRVARLLGVVGLLPLFVAAGAMMAPAVVLAGLAVWHPRWPVVVRGLLAVLTLANVVAVSSTITSDFAMSARSLVGLAGLLLVYACIVWAAAGTFSPPRAPEPPTPEAQIARPN